MPQLEAWEAVFVSSQDFLDSIHGSLGCTACHGGDRTATDIETAHAGIIVDPDSTSACGSCHEDTNDHHTQSLHGTLEGYWTVLDERSNEEARPQLEVAFDNHCASCHASCGQCHVSRPTSAGGGLLDGHTFKATPPMNTTCTGCHGSRINNEFKGLNVLEDGMAVPADVHYNPNGMACFVCHSGDAMHGGLEPGVDHRYDGEPVPACEDCHPNLEGSNPQHTEGHLEDLACQVCHAVEYKNCYSCHVQKNEDDIPYFRTEPSEMAFYIGMNHEQSEERPWSYVVLRHVPIDPESFSYYGDNLLPNFDARPTWVYATPHNIQKSTPQNSSCLNCHGNADIFLTEDKVDPEELEANRPVIVTEIPEF